MRDRRGEFTHGGKTVGTAQLSLDLEDHVGLPPQLLVGILELLRDLLAALAVAPLAAGEVADQCGEREVLGDLHELVRDFAAHVLPVEHDVRSIESGNHRRGDNAPAHTEPDGSQPHRDVIESPVDIVQQRNRCDCGVVQNGNREHQQDNRRDLAARIAGTTGPHRKIRPDSCNLLACHVENHYSTRRSILLPRRSQA